MYDDTGYYDIIKHDKVIIRRLDIPLTLPCGATLNRRSTAHIVAYICRIVSDVIKWRQIASTVTGGLLRHHCLHEISVMPAIILIVNDIKYYDLPVENLINKQTIRQIQALTIQSILVGMHNTCSSAQSS